MRGVVEKSSNSMLQSSLHCTHCRWHSGYHGKQMLNLLPPFSHVLASRSSPQLTLTVPTQFSWEPHYKWAMIHPANNLWFPHPSKTLLLTPQQHYSGVTQTNPSFEGSTCHGTQGKLFQGFVWGLDWLEDHWLYLIQVPFLILILFFSIQISLFLDVGLF